MASESRRVLVSGAGIAGLTLAICLKRHGFEPVIVEREPAMRTEGYMMDFFGTGWDVAERLDLVGALRAIRYPIDFMEYVDDDGASWLRVDIDKIRRALGNKYVYLRRSDLERILHERAVAEGLGIRFDTTVEAIGEEADGTVPVTLSDGTSERFGLVFGADGFHSRVRELTFGPEAQFARFLGFYIAAFHFPDKDYGIGRALKLHETTDRVCGFYPLGGSRMDATFTFRHPDVGHVPHAERLPLLKKTFAGSGWIAEQVLNDVTSGEAVYFDTVTQIVMPRWSKGRVALVGDACGCLTLLAGQGSHMAMAGGYVVASEIARQPGDHAAAFAAYERLLKPAVEAKQRAAARFSKSFVPSANSSRLVRRLTMRLMFAEPFLGLFFRYFGSKSVLAGQSW